MVVRISGRIYGRISEEFHGSFSTGVFFEGFLEDPLEKNLNVILEEFLKLLKGIPG